MPATERIPLEARERWAAALETVPHAFAHTWDSCHAMALTTEHPTYLYVHSCGSQRIVCPFAEREIDDALDLVSPFGFAGFAGSGGDILPSDSWHRFARDQGYVCGYLGLHPTLSNSSWHPPAEVFPQATLYLLDLTLSPDEMFANLSKNRQRELGRASCIVELSASDTSDFLQEHGTSFLLQKGAGPTYRFSAQTYAVLSSSSHTLALGAIREGALCALSMFGYTPYAAEYLFHISLPEGGGYAAALIWSAVQRLRSLGVPLLNLGGGIRSGDGVAEFKRRFGGFTAPYLCLKQVYDTDRFTRICREHNADPNDRSGYFPPYRAPYCPLDAALTT